jgi:TRAP-type C4-dicarboxylate transport system permease small subunit
MIGTTVIDVFLRSIGHPIVGAYEIVGFICGPIVIGFALPLSSWKRNHVTMDILLPRLSRIKRRVMLISTRIASILLFCVAGYNFIVIGDDFRISQEVSQTLHLPFFWVTYGVAVCCFIECVVLVCDIARIGREEA